jgi:Rne/Rng family ribonuclease
MAKELIINASLPEVRIALMEDGRIQELLIERSTEKGIVGNIYKGRVTRVLPGMQAAFVDVGLDKAAFLYVDDIFVHPQAMGAETEVDDASYEQGDYSDEAQGEITEQKPALPLKKAEGSFVVSKPRAPVPNAESSGDALSASSAEGAEASHEQGTDQQGSDSEAQEHFNETETSGAESDAESDVDDELEESEESEEESEELEASSEESEEESDDESEDDSEDEESEEEGSEYPAHDHPGPEGSTETLQAGSTEGGEVSAEGTPSEPGALAGLVQPGNGRRPRGRQRNRRRGRGKDGKQLEGQEGAAPSKGPRGQFAQGETQEEMDDVPELMSGSLNDKGNVESDRAQMEGETGAPTSQPARSSRARPEFKEARNRDRRIKSKHTKPRAQANISDLLKEGQEVIVQIAKDPIATKGARLTCHVSLPGRHLVCMPSIDHVGVSRRIERDDERRRLRDFVERNRPRNMGFIVRTASGGKDPEAWIKQDIDYLSKLWTKIRNKADDVSAPALVYEDLNSILRAIRDWVNEDIDKIIVDSRYHYNELIEFAERFMPPLIECIELYQGDVPIFDAYGISSELHRSLERRVWLKSGGYIVIDQAEALVAVDVNTGRFVGKKNLEDTILKTNLEAADEIAYQLRLRNCGGIIIVDFIDMEREENKMRVYRALEEALRQDRARPTIQKISELGLVEMTRKRTRDTIIRTLCEPCVVCEGKGFSKSTRTVAYEILREIERMGVDREAKKFLISAHESVIDILAIDLREVLDTLEKRFAKTVYLQGIMDFHAEQYEVVTDRSSGKKQSPDIARQLRVERERAERTEKQKARQKEKQQEYSRKSSHDEEEGEEDSLDQKMATAYSENDATTTPIAPTKRAEGAFVIKPRNQGGGGEGDQQSQSRPQPRIRPVEKPLGEEFSAEEGFPSSSGEAQGSMDAGNENGNAPREAGGNQDRGNQNRGNNRHQNNRNQNNRHQNQNQNQNRSPQDDEENQGNRAPRSRGPLPNQMNAGGMPAGMPEGMDDEDQLAYLRAQAAQDAALARLGGNAASAPNAQPARNHQPRPQNNRNQNNNNRGQNNNNRNNRNAGGGGGGRNDQGRNNQGGGGGRFRPQPNQGQGFQRGGGRGPQPNSDNVGNGPAPAQQNYQHEQPGGQNPDYEVLVKPSQDE